MSSLKTQNKSPASPIGVTVAEKIALLAYGKEASKSLNPGYWMSLLGDIGDILLPLVRWMDQDLAQLSPFERERPFPKKFKAKRGMLVSEQISSTFDGLALNREGGWIIKKRGEVFHSCDDTWLALYLTEQKDDLLKASVGFQVTKRFARFLGEHAWMNDLAYHSSIVWFIDRCVGTVRKQLAERQARMQQMQDRLQLFEEFGASLDPVRIQEESFCLPEYRIDHEHERGSNNMTLPGYLTSAAMQPFFEMLPRTHRKPEEYVERPGSRRIDSLVGLVNRIADQLKEIETAEQAGKTLPEQIFGSSSGRLPFDEGEIDVLAQAARSLKPDLQD